MRSLSLSCPIPASELKSAFLLFFFSLSVWFIGFEAVSLEEFPHTDALPKLADSYCEERHYNFKVLQPYNAWSAFVYIFMGCLGFFHKYNNDFLEKRLRGARLGFLIIMYALAIGTFYYHARFTMESSYMDALGMMLFLAFISGYTVSKWTKRAVYFYAIGSAFFAFSMLFIWLLDYLKDEQLKGIQYMTLLGVLFTVISEIIYIVFNNFDSRWDTSEPLPAGLGGVMQAGLEAGPSQDIEASASQYDQSETTTTSIKVIDDFKTGAVVVRMSDSSLSTTTTSSHHHHLDDADVWTVKAKRALYTSRLFIGAVSMIILGYITWNVDSLRWICFPSSPFQGHAVWHLFSGVGIALAFLYAHH